MSVDPDLLSLLPATAGQDSDGALTLSGLRLSDLADEYGTPCLIVDELTLRRAAREYG